MCIKCVYNQLEQLRWELVLQQNELQGEKPSPDVVETVKARLQENGGKPLLPKIRLERPDGMNDQQYGEATYLFKEGMLTRRKAETAAVEIIISLLEHEVLQPFPQINIPANVVLDQEEESPE